MQEYRNQRKCIVVEVGGIQFCISDCRVYKASPQPNRFCPTRLSHYRRARKLQDQAFTADARIEGKEEMDARTKSGFKRLKGAKEIWIWTFTSISVNLTCNIAAALRMRQFIEIVTAEK
ncbi:unnamed protein product [Nezara viridula]|uniref:Uncharacterized protein n=1 Tax=Nezara viridula TaxID=85310 RepID=A0A9P0H0G7_NEZVI|nr:unnamed protein product [Nezara viridula]